MGLLAHGIGGIKDLPVPTWLFYWGGAIVLVLSFVALGVLWRTPLLSRHASGRPLSSLLDRVVLSRVCRIVFQTLSLGFFLLVFAAALFGTTDPSINLAPTWIYVVFWLGMPFLSVLLGNVWRVLSPWRAIADGFVWVFERTGRTAAPLIVLPERLGRWLAAGALFSFLALELAYRDPSSPRVLAFAMAIYTYYALVGYAACGRETWDERGEGFAVAFSYLARIAPLVVVNGRLQARWPLTGLAGTEKTRGSLAVIAVMLGSVGFDGLSRTSWWQNLIGSVEAPYVLERPTLAETLATLVTLGGLVGMILIVALAYLGTCALMRYTVVAPRSLVPDFLLSLMPIAFVYAVAHYFSLFVIQGQFTFSLLSDPFGKGWDLFGTAGNIPNLTLLSANTIWYVQAGALVAGHVAGLAVAHDRAVAIFRDRKDALRSQYAMLMLMILYTVGGLWILSRG